MKRLAGIFVPWCHCSPQAESGGAFVVVYFQVRMYVYISSVCCLRRLTEFFLLLNSMVISSRVSGSFNWGR